MPITTQVCWSHHFSLLKRRFFKPLGTTSCIFTYHYWNGKNRWQTNPLKVETFAGIKYLPTKKTEYFASIKFAKYRVLGKATGIYFWECIRLKGTLGVIFTIKRNVESRSSFIKLVGLLFSSLKYFTSLSVNDICLDSLSTNFKNVFASDRH